MIWIVTTKAERLDFVSLKVERFIKETLGKENVQLIEADENETFSFCNKESDTIVVQTRNFAVINNIRNSGIRNNAESEETINLTYDKELSKGYLQKASVAYPKSSTIDKVEEGKVYFVKPMHGENSNCVNDKSICTSCAMVSDKCHEILQFCDEPIIEEYIEGTECTVAVINNQSKGMFVMPISVEVDNGLGILTHEKKWNESEYCRPIINEALKESAIRAFKAVGAKHYMRIDFRLSKDGVPYCIDFNLYPGLGPTDHLCKCALLCENWSYADLLRMVFDEVNENEQIAH